MLLRAVAETAGFVQWTQTKVGVGGTDARYTNDAVRGMQKSLYPQVSGA